MAAVERHLARLETAPNDSAHISHRPIKLSSLPDFLNLKSEILKTSSLSLPS
jgi:hypothetical protein